MHLLGLSLRDPSVKTLCGSNSENPQRFKQVKVQRFVINSQKD